MCCVHEQDSLEELLCAWQPRGLYPCVVGMLGRPAAACARLEASNLPPNPLSLDTIFVRAFSEALGTVLGSVTSHTLISAPAGFKL